MKKIKDFFSKRIEAVKSAVKKFPITIIIIFILTIILTFQEELFEAEIFENIALVLLLTAFGTLLSEILFAKNKKKYIGIIISLVIGILFDVISENDLIVENVIMRWMAAYIIVFVLLSLYFLSKKSKSFEEYALNTFLNIKRNVIIYGIVCLGLLALYGIFCVLISELDYDIILKIIMLFTGFYFVPILLNSFTDEKAEDTKFNKTIFTRVLLILLCLAMGIVYIYIFKLLFITGIPKNEVFMILSWIFVFLFPICIINKNYCEEDQVLKRVTKILPVLFIPFIILQIYTMGIRISDYGITEERYFSIVLMIFEIISIGMLLYKNSKFLRELILITVFISLVGLISPINYEKISILSQENILKKYASLNKKFDDFELVEQRKYAGAYKYLNRTKGYDFKIEFDIEEKEKLESFNNYYDRTTNNYYDENDERTVYQYYNAKLKDLDISNYSKIDIVSKYISNYTNKENEDILKTYIEINDHQTSIDIDLNELVNKLVEAYKISSATSERIFNENKLLKIDNNRDLYITELTLDFNEETGKIESLSLDGYVLEK